MTRSVAPATLLVLTLLVVAARGGEREWRDARKDYDDALAKVEADRGRDADASKKALDALRAAAAKLGPAGGEEKTTEYVLDHGVKSPRRAAAQVALDLLAQVTDARATRALTKAFEGADGATKALLGEALHRNPAAEVTTAYVRALRDRDEATRALAARCLTGRGADARQAAEGPLTRALRDDSLLVRLEAARALESLTGARPDGFAEPTADALGLLDRYPYDRVAFLVDASAAAAERDFVDPDPAPVDTSAPAPRGRHGQEEKKPAGPAPVSPHDLVVRGLKAALARLGDGTGVYLARFGGDGAYRSMQGAFAPLKNQKARDEAAAFLERTPDERGRDVLEAVRRALALDPPPQVVHLFLVGPPEGRGLASNAETIEAVRDLVWGKHVRLDVTAFELAPAQPPTDERGRQALGEWLGAYGAFVQQLAEAGGGQAVRVQLQRPTPEEASAHAGPPAPKLGVDLTKPVASRDLSTVQKALHDAIDKADEAGESLVEDAGACPDRKVAPLVLEALRSPAHGIQQAAVRGLQKNADPGVEGAVLEALRGERQPDVQLLLVQALGRSPVPAATAGLVEMVGALSPYGQRLAWSLLAQRPAAELKEQQGHLARAARGLNGLADFHARTALAVASGTPAPSPAGLTTAEGALLPERFVAGGVAFVVDTQRDMGAVFYTPPAPPAPATPADDEQHGRAHHGREPAAPPPPQPVTRLGAAQKEVARALRAVAQAGGKANVITMDGRSWSSAAQALDDKRRDDAVGWVEGLEAGPARDVWKALKQALEDPAVEVIHVLVAGTPIRSLGQGDPSELLQAVRGLQRDRGVEIDVVYVLGPVGGAEGGPEAAARQDQLTAMDAVYRTLAEESGGHVLVRETVASLAAAAPPAPAPRR
jgi:hypothetical protein